MRLLSACSKSLTGRRLKHPRVALLLLSALLFSCSTRNISEYRSNNTIDGIVVIRGGGPLTRTVLVEDRHGIRTVVKSVKWRAELASLKGRRVMVRGDLEGSPRFGYSIRVQSYQLVPPPGMIAVRGVLSLAEDQLRILNRETGESYIIEGKLGPALRQLAGYQIWVWGGEEDSIITAEGYELTGSG